MFPRLFLFGFALALFFNCAWHKDWIKPKDQPDSSAVKSVYKKDSSNAGKKSPDNSVKKEAGDSLQVQLPRNEALVEWSQKIRSTVEPYWVLPKVLVKHKYRAVARIRIGHGGDIRNVTWVEKSHSTVFNNLAVKALKKVKHFPPFPPTVQDSVLEIQYEFVTPGIMPPRRKLELLKSAEP